MEREIRTIDILTVNDLPEEQASWDEIFYLALSFDAYEYWDTFEKTAGISAKVKLAYKKDGTFDCCSLIELRTELFMIERTYNHLGDQPKGDKLAYIHELVEAIRKKVIHE